MARPLLVTFTVNFSIRSVVDKGGEYTALNSNGYSRCFFRRRSPRPQRHICVAHECVERTECRTYRRLVDIRAIRGRSVRCRTVRPRVLRVMCCAIRNCRVRRRRLFSVLKKASREFAKTYSKSFFRPLFRVAVAFYRYRLLFVCRQEPRRR